MSALILYWSIGCWEMHIYNIIRHRGLPNASVYENRSTDHKNGVRKKCQLDKMPTRQNANQRLAFCPDFLLWLAFCPSQFLVGILSGPSQHVLAFCQNHEKCHHLSECEWGFVRSVDFLPYRQKAKAKWHWLFIHMRPTYTTQNVLRMILDDLSGSHMFPDVFIIFSVFSGCSPKST